MITMLQKNALRTDLGYAGAVMLLLLFSQNLLRMPFLLLRGGWRFPAALSSTLTLLVYLMSMLVTILFARYIYRSGLDFAFPAAAVRQDYQLPAIGAGLGAAMVGNLVAMALALLLGTVGIYSRGNVPSFGGGFVSAIITIITVTILPAVLEEFLFRGALLQPLRKYGDRVAIVVSAVLFALCHPTLPQAVNALLMGLCLGVFTVRTGSLSTGIAIHFVYNSLACVTALVMQFASPHMAILINYSLMGLCLVGGTLCTLHLRRRFGRVWWVAPHPQGGRVPVFAAAATSVPLVAAVLLMAITILRNFYFV